MPVPQKHNIVITMAGFGSRFTKAGYDCPKYQIEVHGKPLFDWSLLSLSQFLAPENKVIFIVRKDDQAADFIQKRCAILGIERFELIELDAPTDGQATSAALAVPYCDPDKAMLIYNIDTLVLPKALPDAIPANTHGWIPCFQAEGDHWSFVGLNDAGIATEVREKQRISAHATIGLYWFSSAQLYQDTYQTYYADTTNLEKGEKYIAPLYNHLIQHKQDVRILDVPVSAVHPLGTPAEVDLFKADQAPEL